MIADRRPLLLCVQYRAPIATATCRVFVSDVTKPERVAFVSDDLTKPKRVACR